MVGEWAPYKALCGQMRSRDVLEEKHNWCRELDSRGGEVQFAELDLFVSRKCGKVNAELHRVWGKWWSNCLSSSKLSETRLCKMRKKKLFVSKCVNLGVFIVSVWQVVEQTKSQEGAFG